MNPKMIWVAINTPLLKSKVRTFINCFVLKQGFIGFSACQLLKRAVARILRLLPLRFCQSAKKQQSKSIRLILKWNFRAPAGQAGKMSTKLKRLSELFINQLVFTLDQALKEVSWLTEKKRWR